MTIHYEKDDMNIVVLSMDLENRSQNVINDSLLKALKRVTQKLFSEDSLAGVVLTSKKKDFLAGADLDNLYMVTDPRELMDWLEEFKAIMRKLESAGYTNIVTQTHAELDLTDQAAVQDFFKQQKPEYVFLAAAKVGGIHANNTYPAEFIQQNLVIQNNIIHQSWRTWVKRLLFLGSSCIYPRDCPQPMKEESLLTGPLESTNRPYAVAKIAGIEMCWSYNREYNTQYLAATTVIRKEKKYFTMLITRNIISILTRKSETGAT